MCEFYFPQIAQICTDEDVDFCAFIANFGG